MFLLRCRTNFSFVAMDVAFKLNSSCHTAFVICANKQKGLQRSVLVFSAVGESIEGSSLCMLLFVSLLGLSGRWKYPFAHICPKYSHGILLQEGFTLSSNVYKPQYALHALVHVDIKFAHVLPASGYLAGGSVAFDKWKWFASKQSSGGLSGLCGYVAELMHGNYANGRNMTTSECYMSCICRRITIF